MINEITKINSLDNISDYISTILEFKKKELMLQYLLLMQVEGGNSFELKDLASMDEEDLNMLDKLFNYKEKLEKIPLNLDLIEYLMEKLPLKGNSVYLIFQLAKEILNKNYTIIRPNIYLNNKNNIDLSFYYKSSLTKLENDVKQLSDLLFELTKTLIEA